MTLVTIITPTVGRPSLQRLIDTVDGQTVPGSTMHLLLWDQHREGNVSPETYNSVVRHSIVLPDGTGRHGDAPGSALRAIGLMTARTPWVTFADDDVFWAADHVETITAAMSGHRWASTLRTVWSDDGCRLGVDRFESVGDDASRGVPYEMLDNNCMTFERPLGVAAAWMYRETVEYNDDRLMYRFLKERGGPRGRTNRSTINQVCPARLTDMFRSLCSPD